MMRLPRLFRPGHSLFGLLVGGAIGLSALTQGGVAEAGRGRFGGGIHFSGSVRWHGGSGVRFARPSWRPRSWVGGSVWVGGYYYPRPYYYYYYPYPEYVPSYYGSYYPVQPATSAPGVVAVAAPTPPPMPTFGIGVFAGGSSVQNASDSRSDTSDLGALARIRLTPGLLIEGEIAQTSFKDDVRVDRKIGGSLIYEIGAENTFAPYLLAGGGVQQADVAGSFETTQDYGEIGVGLRWALSRSLHLALDIRAGRRQTVDSNQPVFLASSVDTVAPGPNNGDTEDFTRGRLAAILNF